MFGPIFAPVPLYTAPSVFIGMPLYDVTPRVVYVPYSRPSATYETYHSNTHRTRHHPDGSTSTLSSHTSHNYSRTWPSYPRLYY